MPEKLYAYGDAETKDLHWRYGSEVLISDDKEKLLRIVNSFCPQVPGAAFRMWCRAEGCNVPGPFPVR